MRFKNLNGVKIYRERHRIFFKHPSQTIFLCNEYFNVNITAHADNIGDFLVDHNSMILFYSLSKSELVQSTSRKRHDGFRSRISVVSYLKLKISNLLVILSDARQQY